MRKCEKYYPIILTFPQTFSLEHENFHYSFKDLFGKKINEFLMLVLEIMTSSRNIHNILNEIVSSPLELTHIL